ncbi:glycosyltransferase family 4 protein [Hungatella hathewayi]|uniref:glycosyltransferase family 4 protein n=1 Tax=Hungatella hathewayi TaxID=154046 RepID=UPI003563B630
MNILFVSISELPQMDKHSISLDLLHEFKKNGHTIYAVCANERRNNSDTFCSEEDGYHVLRVKTGNNKKANLIEKGVTTIRLPFMYIFAIKRYYSGVKFDLVLYPTPPVTHARTVEFIKKRDGAVAYLLLKDIFPQNAVDIGMLSKKGLKAVVYKYFRHKEKKLYALSDYIGCMSNANVEYILKHNLELNAAKVELFPNAVEPIDMSVADKEILSIREKYAIPQDRVVFMYGGNLGKPQGIPFLIDCLKKQRDNEKTFFLIIGDGTEYGKIDAFIKEYDPPNVKLLKKLPKEEYDCLVAGCDVGMIFLDHRFTIPNFPSRLLSYMQAKIPVLAATDGNTDVGKVIVEGEFGWWCESNDSGSFIERVDEACSADRTIMGQKAWNYMIENYTAEKGYHIIMKHLENENMSV